MRPGGRRAEATAVSCKGERSLMEPPTTVGGVLALLGMVCAAVGIFVLEGVPIVFPGIILGGWATISALRASTGWGRFSGQPRRSST